MRFRIAVALVTALSYVVLRELGLLPAGLLLALLGVAALEILTLGVALARRHIGRSGWHTPRFWLALTATAALAALLAWGVLLSTFTNDVPADERHSFDAQVLVLAALAPLARAVPRSATPPLPLAQLTLVVLLGLELAWQARPLPTGAAVEMASPFSRPVLVMHGGLGPLTNHHALVRTQAHAVDLLSDGARGPHDCQGEPLLAPVPGRITSVVSDLPDSPPNGSDLVHIAGNHLVIEVATGGPYVLLAHLEQGSVRVRVGEIVRRGDLIARCGNSGNSTQAHLHLQAQNQPHFDANSAALRTFPIRFVDVWRTRGGTTSSGTLSVRRNDVFAPSSTPPP